MNLTEQEYNEQIKAIAADLVSEVMPEFDNDKESAEDIINDYRLHETIDSHQWIIYYAYNDDVIRWSMNPDAYQDVYSNEDVGALIADKGLDSFGTARAYFAMYQDVQEALEQAFDEFESE